jgi:hypothetical protein
MNTNSLQISLENITEKVLNRSDCAETPVETRADLANQIQLLLLQRWINTALANLSEEEAVELLQRAKDTENPEEIIKAIGEIFNRNPEATTILLEEAQYLEEELATAQ